MDRKQNVYGSPRIAVNPSLLRSDSDQRKHQPFMLGQGDELFTLND